MLLEHIGQPLWIGESALIKLELSLPSPWTKPRSDYFWSNCEVSHIFLIGITQSGLWYFPFIKVNPLLFTFMKSIHPVLAKAFCLRSAPWKGNFHPGQTREGPESLPWKNNTEPTKYSKARNKFPHLLLPDLFCVKKPKRFGKGLGNQPFGVLNRTSSLQWSDCHCSELKRFSLIESRRHI